MNNNDKFELQQRLEDYLNMVTTKSKYKQYVCPLCKSGTGSHRTGALSVKTDINGVPRVTCFACNGFRNSDIFEAVGKVENISDFKEQYNRVSAMFSYNIMPMEKAVVKELKEKSTQVQVDFSSFYLQKHDTVYLSNYLIERGISQEIIDKYLIGYAEDWKHPNSQSMKNKSGIIIPVSKYSYVFRDINANDNYRYFRIKTRNNPEDKFFNFSALTRSVEPVYIVEGEIDALSIITAGQEAVALGSVVNVNDFFESCKDLDVRVPLILFLDNDEAGLRATDIAYKKLEEINIYRKNKGLNFIVNAKHSFKTFEIFKGTRFEGLINLKDANELLEALGVSDFSYYLKVFNRKLIEKIEEKLKAVSSSLISKETIRSKIINLKIENFISEQKDAILNCIHENKKTLLVAPMGTGKTKLIQEINKNIVDVVTVIVNPTVAQLKQMEHDYNITAVYGGLTYNDESIVCVTPESLKKKVIDRLNRPFMLVVDEAHEKYTSYNFRKFFGDIEVVEKMALYTVYMTATPDILLEDGVEQFDAVVKIHKTNLVEQKTRILEVENYSIEQKTALIKESLKRADLVVLHNENKKENEVICDTLNKKLHIKTEIDSYFQQNMFGLEPQYITSVKNTTVSLDASKRDTKDFIELTSTSKIDKDVKLFCTTSCIQAGLNINNDRSTIIIYACNNQDFKSVNFLQSVGRYRNKKNVVEIDLLKSKLDKTLMDFRNFSTLYEEELKLVKDLERVVNDYYKISKDKEEAINLAKAGGLIFNDEKNCFEIDYNFIKAKAQSRYNKSLLYHPEVLKKNLEADDATNLKIEIEDYKPEPEREVKEMLKSKKEEIKLIFQSATKEMYGYSDEQLQQVLDYTIDQRKKENQEVVEVMKNYHETVGAGFSKLLKETAELKNVTRAEAFRYMMQFKTLQEVKDKLSEIKVMSTNKLINQIGIDTIYADSVRLARGLPAEHKKTALIRYVLKDVEKERGRISKELKQDIIDKAVEIKLYKIKNPSDIEKIRQDIEKYINMIYKFRNNYLISSIKLRE